MPWDDAAAVTVRSCLIKQARMLPLGHLRYTVTSSQTALVREEIVRSDGPKILKQRLVVPLVAGKDCR